MKNKLHLISKFIQLCPVHNDDRHWDMSLLNVVFINYKNNQS